eukprot:snap_masked-scaffold_8-processed-gene-9.44-mRNA-1 protein AED:1.00 eAED:1.00 QI:0/0/0/0/1/1/2/0/75
MFEKAWKELQLVCVTSEDVKLQEAEHELEQLEAGPDVLLTVTKFKVAVKKMKQEGGECFKLSTGFEVVFLATSRI